MAFCACAAICFAMFFCMKDSAADAKYNFVLAIDAGHGGVDGGVVGKVTGVKESDLNLETARQLKDKFEHCGFVVVMTRDTQDGLYGEATEGFKRRDMMKRREIILQSKANLVISVHMNKFSSSSRSGPQVFFNPNNGDSVALAKSLQASLNDFTGNDHSALGGDYFMLRCTSAPSVIVECGFLSNPDDEAKLCDEKYREQLAEVILKGTFAYLAGAKGA